ncbi:MAG: hypothetical protein ACREQB_13020 [Candidatus Binataceae bacterium]
MQRKRVCNARPMMEIIEWARSELRIIVTADLDYPRLLAMDRVVSPGLAKTGLAMAFPCRAIMTLPPRASTAPAPSRRSPAALPLLSPGDQRFAATGGKGGERDYGNAIRKRMKIER